MPVVELDIGGTPTKVQVSDGYTPDDLDHIAKTLQPDTSTAMSRAGQYLTHKGSEFVGALQGVQKDVQNVVSGEPYGTGFPGERGALDTVGDVATAAAPVVAPWETGIGLAAGTAARAAGADESTANIANVAGSLGTGAVRAIAGGAKAVSGIKGAIQAKYGQVAEQAGKAGNTLAMGTKAGDEFATAISDAAEWPGAHPAERAMAKPLLDKLTAPNSPGLTYDDLDGALAGLRKIRGPSYVRGLVNDAAQGLIEGTPAAKTRLAAQAAYRGMKGKALLRGGGGLLTRGGAALYGLQQAQQGNYGRAAAGLGGAVLGGMSPSTIATAVRGAAGPLAQTATAVGGQLPGMQSGGGGGGGDEAPAPADIGTAAPAAPETPPPSPSARIQPLPGPYGREIAAVAHLVGVPGNLIQSVMTQESGGHPGAVSHPGPDQIQTPALGLMQITPGTFKSVAPQVGKLLGRAPDIGNPFDNILAGGVLWRRYLDKSNGDVGLAAKMYHGGEGTQAWGPRTEQYSRDIDRRYAAAAGGEGG